MAETGALNRREAARYVGVTPDEFVSLAKRREMPRPRLLRDGEPFWLPADLLEALTLIPYVDGTRADVKRRSQVYFIGPMEARFIKVGVAINVEARIRELQTGNPERLVIYASVPGLKQDESTFHAILKPLRAEGEWFKRGPWLDVVRNGVMEGQSARDIIKALREQNP
jgi:hypothetical protein